MYVQPDLTLLDLQDLIDGCFIENVLYVCCKDIMDIPYLSFRMNYTFSNSKLRDSH